MRRPSGRPGELRKQEFFFSYFWNETRTEARSLDDRHLLEIWQHMAHIGHLLTRNDETRTCSSWARSWDMSVFNWAVVCSRIQRSNAIHQLGHALSCISGRCRRIRSGDKGAQLQHPLPDVAKLAKVSLILRATSCTSEIILVPPSRRNVLELNNGTSAFESHSVHFSMGTKSSPAQKISMSSQAILFQNQFCEETHLWSCDSPCFYTKDGVLWHDNRC